MVYSRFLKHCLVLTAVITIPVPSTALAQMTVWGLQRDDHFSVETVIEREITLQLGDQPETVIRSADTLVLQYTVVNVLPGGDIAVHVRVQHADRDPRGPSGPAGNTLARQLAVLRSLAVILVVDVDGIVKAVPGYRESLSRLADTNPSGQQLVNESIPEDVVATWFGHPFWMTVSQDKQEKGTRWECIDQTSLGQLGALRTVATCEIDSVDEAAVAGITISGDSRYMAPESADRDTTSPLDFFAAKAAMDSFSGTGAIVFGQNVNDSEVPEPDTRRPQFEKLVLEFSCSGTAMARSGGTERNLRFQQRQKQSSRLLPGYRMGREQGLRIFSQPQP